MRFKRCWYLDSGRLRHMISDKKEFVTFEMKEGGVVTFGDNGQGYIFSIGNIHITPSTFIENILYVKGLVIKMFT